MRSRFVGLGFLIGVAALAACGGGGGGGVATLPQPAPSAAASSAAGATSTATVTVGSQPQTASLPAISSGVGASVTVPAASSGGGSATVTLGASPPSNLPALQSVARSARGLGRASQSTRRGATDAGATTVYAYALFAVSSALTLSASPSFTLTFTSPPPANQSYYAAYYNGSTWQDAYLTGTLSGSTITFAANPAPLSWVPGSVYAFAFYATATPGSPSPAVSTSPGSSASPAASPSAGASGSPAPSPSPSHAPAGSPSPAASTAPSASPIPSPSPSHAASPSPAASASPVPSPSPSHAPAPSPSPSHAPAPSPSPSHVPASPSPLPSPSPGTTLTGPGTYGGTGGPWGPTAVANAFSFPVQIGFNGSGQTVAIIIDSAPLSSDLTSYFTYFQTPSTSRTITQNSVDGGASSTSDIFEATLDSETIGGLAPGANIVIYEIPELTDEDINDAANAAISDGSAKVVSMSFGGCENGYDSTVTSPTFATGAGDGVTFVASSGDFGNECPTSATSDTPGVNYPASDPNVVGVGGNESDTSLTNPVAWNESIGGLAESSTGGGVSAEFTLPPFQNGITGLASNTNRNVPDIALPSVNVAVYQGGSWQEGVGTSWSAPEFAAMAAELDQYCGSSLGNANTSLYAAFSAASSDFIDVTSGNNQYNGTAPSPFYTATAGYDNTTGLGLPVGISIAESACGSTPAGAHRSLPAAAHRSGRGAASVTFALNHPSDRAFSERARPAALRSAADLGERSSTATTPIQVVLTPAAARMGGDSNVATILRANGFAVTKTFRDHLIVDAQGTTTQVERLFATSIHNFAQWRRGTRYAPTGSLTVPATLAPFVSGVVLTNAVTRYTPQRGKPVRGGFRF